MSVQLVDGTVRDVSLREVFTLAPRARGVVGELPTTAFAVTRLLLAILYRALGGAIDLESWADLWDSNDLPSAALGTYLDQHSPRFDLLSPTAPFFQVADLRTARDEMSPLSVLIADVPNGIPFQTTRRGASLEAISFAEAARWLIHAQAYETSGIKSAAIGDDRTRNGKGYPIGTGWAGALGGVLAEGATLRETLLLNLAGYTAEYDDKPDLPPWETEPDTAASTRLSPSGPVGAYTWQKARIRLVTDDDVVVGVVLANGDRAALANQQRVEPMTGWYYSLNQAKATKTRPYYLPARHDPDRAFWRGIAGVLPNTPDPRRTDGFPATQPPGVLQWLNRLCIERALPESTTIRLRAIGMVYGTQNAVITDLIDDAYALHVAVLAETHPELGEVAKWAVGLADRAVRALGTFAADLVRSDVGDNPGDAGAARIDAARSAAAATCYASLDGLFRSWIAELSAESVLAAVRDDWRGQVRDTVEEIAAQLARGAPPTTMVQRPNHGMCVPLAEQRFHRYLREHLEPTPDDQGVDHG